MPRRSLALLAAVAGAVAVLVLALVWRGGREDEKAYCEQVARVAAANASGVLAQFDLDDPDASAATLEGAVDDLAALAALAPDSISADADAVATTTADIVEALTDLETDPVGARARLDRLQERYGAFTAASARLVADGRDRCGVSLDGQPPTTATTAPA